MTNWTDPIIHWNQLPGTEVRRLIDTWGMSPEQIAKYDKKHGFALTKPQTKAEPVKTAEPAKKVAAKPNSRQRHRGADGEIQFLSHRNMFIGFAGGKVVVTKRTRAACELTLRERFGIEPVQG